MKESASKVLVVYWSGTGCTEGIAERIGKMLANAGVQVDVRTFESDPRPEDYDAILAGSSVRAFSWHAQAAKWVTCNREALQRKPLWFFTVGGAMARSEENVDQTRRVTDSVLAKTGLQPRDIGLFAGWYLPERFTFFERIIMRITGAPEGDTRDWDAVEAWAQSVARDLRPVHAGSGAALPAPAARIA